MKPVFIISRKMEFNRKITLQDRLNKGGIDKFTIVDAYEPSEENDKILRELTNKNWVFDCRLKNMEKNESRKACYLSHVLLLKALVDQGINTCFIGEDDIYFKDDYSDVFKSSPQYSLVNYYDNTHIEILDKKNFCQELGNDFIRIDHRFKVWCTGFYEINDCKKLLEILIQQQPKVYDGLHTNHIQRYYVTYLFNGYKKIYQNRKLFESGIK
jgi:GR25 family glycosyltransferase involved in LPS biosynthesis